MSDFLYILDELFNAYANTRYNGYLTKQFCILYNMFVLSLKQPSINNIKYPSPNDLYNELISHSIPVILSNSICYLHKNNRLIRIRGFGELTYYITSSFAQTHSSIHRKALARFIRKGGAIKIYNDIITSEKQLKKYLP